MGFFDFIRRAKDHVMEAGKKVFGIAGKISDGIKDTYRKVTNIPVIGNVVKGIGDQVLNTNIGGVRVGDVLNTADKVITAGRDAFGSG